MKGCTTPAIHDGAEINRQDAAEYLGRLDYFEYRHEHRPGTDADWKRVIVRRLHCTISLGVRSRGDVALSAGLCLKASIEWQSTQLLAPARTVHRASGFYVVGVSAWASSHSR
jgi:hypothetical protein